MKDLRHIEPSNHKQFSRSSYQGGVLCEYSHFILIDDFSKSRFVYFGWRCHVSWLLKHYECWIRINHICSVWFLNSP